MFEKIQSVVELWKADGVKLNPPFHIETTMLTLIFASRPLANDSLYLYSLCNGMKENTSDQHFFELWSLEHVAKETLNFPAPFIPFADGLISAHIYLLKYESPDVSSVWVTYLNNEPPTMLASSLNEAFDLLLSNPGKLYLL